MSGSKRARWPLAIAVTGLGALSLWFVLAPATEGTQTTKRVPTVKRVPVTERVVVNKQHAEAASVSASSSAAAVRPELASPTRPPPSIQPLMSVQQVVGPHPEAPHEPGMLPHPMDEARARIAAENGLIQALNDAMSFRKVKKMRELLVDYRALDSSDVDAHQLGYEVIADCIEFPGNASRTAAQEFYDSQRHSPLRRFVRRTCFENPN